LLLSLLFFLAAPWLFGNWANRMAKSYCSTNVGGGYINCGCIGRPVFCQQTTVAQFETAYHTDAKAFVKTEQRVQQNLK